MECSLNQKLTSQVFDQLAEVNKSHKSRRPGPDDRRQPVHTVYGGAHLFKAGTLKRLGDMALKAFEVHAATPDELCRALNLDYSAQRASELHTRIRTKLEAQAVEDFRIDFEDGFGNRPQAEEDETALQAAEQLAMAMKSGICSPFIGIRIKPLNDELMARSVRTFDLFLTRLLNQTAGELPPGFTVTLPKITDPFQVQALANLMTAMEEKFQLSPRSLTLEVMVETPESILDEAGACALPAIVAAAQGRCRGAHFGTYDYTASMDITAAFQAMDHPACDFARHFMKTALAGRGVWISDGATNVMPVGPHRGDQLDSAQTAANRTVVHQAWKLAFDHTRHSLRNAIYQGWDLHPGQLPIRYAAIYSFFMEGLEAASERLSNFMGAAAKATLSGDVFDDAATGQGLLNFFLRAYACGAIDLSDLLATGLTEAEIRTRSFLKILEMRQRI